jgi:hypothetical protein
MPRPCPARQWRRWCCLWPERSSWWRNLEDVRRRAGPPGRGPARSVLVGGPDTRPLLDRCGGIIAVAYRHDRPDAASPRSECFRYALSRWGPTGARGFVGANAGDNRSSLWLPTVSPSRPRQGPHALVPGLTPLVERSQPVVAGVTVACGLCLPSGLSSHDRTGAVEVAGADEFR